MDKNDLKSLSYEELRQTYIAYLKTLQVSGATVNTASVDTFYLWRKGNSELFWETVESADFDKAATSALTKALTANSKGNVPALVSGYVSHLRRFRKWVLSGTVDDVVAVIVPPTSKPQPPKKPTNGVPVPTVELVEYYLGKWDSLENYHLQENALDKLFFKLCPKNTDISDILLKASTLNDFYSTNIYSIFPIAQHIQSLDIDARLKAGDVTLVNYIQRVVIGGKEMNFYSFATKYCSHHNPLDYPIYDSYVDTVLRYFRKKDEFSDFRDAELKDYVRFKGVLIDFRAFYQLDKYNLKEIDKFLWQFGKDYFPKKYGKQQKAVEE